MNSLFNKTLYFICLIIGFFLIFKNNQDLNNYYIFIISLIFISSISIVFLPIIKPYTIGKLPIFNLINLYFLICYVGIFFFDKNIILLENYRNYEYQKSINILFFGYLFFLIGYFIANNILKKFKRKSFVFLEASDNEMLIIGFLALFSSVTFFYFIEIQNYFSFLNQVKFPILLFGIGLSFKCVLQKKLKYWQIFLLTTLIILPIFLELLSGSFNFPFLVTFLLYVQYVIHKQKINILPFLFLSLFFLTVHIGKYDYRLLTWNKKELNFSIIDKSKFFFKSYFDNDVLIIDGELKQKDLNFLNYIKTRDNFRLERRVFHSYWSLLIVTKNSPDLIPFWDGYSYKLLITKIIPRMFWRNKPSDRLGNEFGHRYNVLSKNTETTVRDNSTSWNMPVLNEFYVNFGKLGVIIGMFLFGLFISFLTKFSSIEKNNNLENVICIYLFIPIFFLESHLSLLIGAIIQSYIFLIFLSFGSLFFLRKIFPNMIK